MAAGVAPTTRAGHIYYKPFSSDSRGIFKREGGKKEDEQKGKRRGRREEVVGKGRAQQQRAIIRWQNFLLIKEKSGDNRITKQQYNLTIRR